MLGTVLGVGAFVAVLGLTSTVAGQVSERFTVLAATEVTVEEVPDDQRGPAFPPDADERITTINGVRNAGIYWTYDGNSVGGVTGVPALTRPGAGPGVVAATPGLLRAAGPTLQQGRLFDERNERTSDRVAVIGAAVAAQLGVTDVAYQPAVFINGVPFTVIGVFDDIRRLPELLLTVVVPASTAAELWGASKEPTRMLVETQLGAAGLISSQIPYALRPDAPDRFTVKAPPDPKELRDRVDTDLSALFLVLAGVCLVIGAAGIANTTFVGVLERTGEIGLRRALGARRAHITALFLAESGLLGVVGGVLGASLGTTAMVLVSIAKQWTPLMESWTVFTAPLIGLVVGLTAGAYPALRAARIEPADALRR
jgi:putative ABC transport system permease protein